jgi:hypothetical protein
MSRLSDETVIAGLRAAVRLRSGAVPTDTELEGAPMLSGWVLERVIGGYRRFGGFVSGHPNLPDGWCWTSVVLFIEPDRRWARTISRLYRLGNPLWPEPDEVRGGHDP